MALPDLENAYTPAATAPATITLTIWFDREMDVDTNGVPPWLVQAALAHAYELMEPQVLFAEDDDEDDDDTED